VVVVALLVAHGSAWGAWSDSSSASAQYSSALLAPPTNPAAVLGICTVLTSDQIVLSWTATASTWADGYEIARSTTSGGPYSVIGTVGQPTVVFTDGPLPFSTSYYYVVRATKNSWRSPYTTEVTRSTRTALCV